MENSFCTVEETREKIAKDFENVHSIDANIKDFEYTGGADKFLHFKHGDQKYVFGPNISSLLCKWMSVPLDFFIKCDDELRKSIMGKFMKERAISLILTGENVAEDILPQGTPYVSFLDVFDAVVRKVEDAQVEKYVRGQESSVLNILGKTVAEPPTRKGDVTRGGVTVEMKRSTYAALNSRVSVGSYLHRLVCTNGLIGEQRSLSGVRGLTRPEILKNIEDMSTYAMEEMEKALMPKFVHLDDTAIDNPAQLIHQMSTESRLPVGLEKAALDRVPSLGDSATAYDVVNLVTSLANEYEDVAVMRRIQGAAGVVTKSVDARCSACKRLLR